MTKNYTLSQLNALISEEIKRSFPDTYWIIAETSDVRVNANGHCYLELIEKIESNKNIIARSRAYIWNSNFLLLKTFFENTSGQVFTSGIKVLVRVSIDFHPLYGYGLNIIDIDPAYTIGDVNKRRQDILNRLEKEGVLTLNKELDMPLFPQCIAIISSNTAAGYEDFLEHLMNNKFGYVFYPVLFPAIMQGAQTEDSIIKALNNINDHRDYFDVVVIIRGGGASSDLASFDTYDLALNCSQFPLPIVTGIGHERDDTVLDFISYYRAKTPTAVAAYLINYLDEVNLRILEIESDLSDFRSQLIDLYDKKIRQLAGMLPITAVRVQEKNKLLLDLLRDQLMRNSIQLLNKEKLSIKEKEIFFELSSPEYILSKGYSITLKAGKAIKSSEELKDKDVIETIFSKGRVKSSICFENMDKPFSD